MPDFDTTDDDESPTRGIKGLLCRAIWAALLAKSRARFGASAAYTSSNVTLDDAGSANVATMIVVMIGYSRFFIVISFSLLATIRG
ncbi:hypothetical protein [Vibrio cyclitrophicus]|uniref:hypothetical protein n=1 Tax=Vibrio cyclitrophicus TaxID=47951 RepID=UPI00105432EC|nr:hypothetical protein [Vibrio cyclitrophicus]